MLHLPVHSVGLTVYQIRYIPRARPSMLLTSVKRSIDDGRALTRAGGGLLELSRPAKSLMNHTIRMQV